MSEHPTWLQLTADDPGHSHAYVQRFRRLAEQGQDLVGEARLVDAMLQRESRVLDAGCGFGRVERGPVATQAGRSTATRKSDRSVNGCRCHDESSRSGARPAVAASARNASNGYPRPAP